MNRAKFIFCVLGLFCIFVIVVEAQSESKKFLSDYYLALGDLHYKNHDLETNLDLAEDYYQKALSLIPLRPELYWKIPRVWWVRSEKTEASEIKKESFEQALNYLRQGEESYPTNVDIKLWKAIVNGSYLAYKNFIQAVLTVKDEVYENAQYVVETAPEKEEAYLLLAIYYYLLPETVGGNKSRSVQLAQTAVEKNPSFTRAYLVLSGFYFDKEEFFKARQILEQLLQIQEPKEPGFFIEDKKKARDMLARISQELESKL